MKRREFCKSVPAFFGCLLAGIMPKLIESKKPLATGGIVGTHNIPKGRAILHNSVVHTVKYIPEIVKENPATVLKNLIVDAYGEDMLDMETFEEWEKYCDEKVEMSELRGCENIHDALVFCTERGKRIVWMEDGLFTVMTFEASKGFNDILKGA